MDKDLEKTLHKILEKSIELAEKTGEFAIKEGTELLQQFYAWHIASYIFWIFFAILLFTSVTLIIRRFGKKERPERMHESEEKKMRVGYMEFYTKPNKEYMRFLGRFYEEGDISFSVGFFFSVTSLASVIILLGNLYHLLFILIAPKLYLIEYFIK